MIEPFADNLKSDSMLGPLDIAPCLSQGMSTIVAFQIDSFSPTLD
jgi:hypothetical protein